MNIALWIIQVLLGLLFVFSGVVKFVTPVDEMLKQMPVALSGAFIHFIGVCEILGGIGLILPALLRIKPGLTPLAAVCLIIIMIGAVAIAFIGGACQRDYPGGYRNSARFRCVWPVKVGADQRQIILLL